MLLTLVLVYRGGCGDITCDRVGGDPQAGGGGRHRVTAPHGGTVQVGVRCHDKTGDPSGICQTEQEERSINICISIGHAICCLTPSKWDNDVFGHCRLCTVVNEIQPL